MEPVLIGSTLMEVQEDSLLYPEVPINCQKNYLN